MSDEQQPKRPAPDGYMTWPEYWQAQGMSWRTQPEIDELRQRYLAERRAVRPEIAKNIYPFRNENGSIALTREDVEWLLATHDGGQGPVDFSKRPERWRIGLDLRGANLAGVNLSELPLARILGGLARRPPSPRVLAISKVWPSGSSEPAPKNAVPYPYEWGLATPEQRRAAAVNLDGANLYRAHLEGAVLTGARLLETNLHEAVLNGANLCNANLRGATLEWADLTSADLREAHLEHVNLIATVLYAADIRRSFMDGGTMLGVSLGSTRLADVQWGTATLGEVHWFIPTGDEEEAWRKEAPDGGSKSGRVGEFEEAVRTYRQIASALRAQGLNEDADRFAYHAQRLQRHVLVLRGRLLRTFGSWLLDLVSGYGYRPLRSVAAYVLIICLFSGAYLLNAQFAAPHLRWDEALVLSVSSFHGRGFFTSGITLGDTLARLAAAEAIVGLLIEITFIATFTQRFFAR